jgi:fumarylacetoacetase
MSVAPDDGFGTENLPYGVDDEGHVVVAWHDQVVDLTRADGIDAGPDIWSSGSLNSFLALGPAAWAVTRSQLQATIDRQPARALRPRAGVRLVLPVEVGDYVDFYASRQHATNMGRLLRPGEDPLPPAWLHLPIGYHGRSGTMVASGTVIRRPSGLTANGPAACLNAASGPTFGPSQRLDVEVELGFVVGAPVPYGMAASAATAERHVFGVTLINDWSARDIQAFEYRPLGPFLGKSFATSMSPWVVPLAALTQRRVRGPRQDPPPAQYLRAPEPRGLDVELTLEVNGVRLSTTNSRFLYWSMSQQLAHLTVNGSGACTGDVFASGTISGDEPDSYGSLMELSGGTRWLADGDTVTISGRCGSVSLGEVVGTVVGCGS